MIASSGITLLGLGPGDPALLTREAWALLEKASEIYLRTKQHPTVAGFPETLEVHSFDQFYEEEEGFDAVYARIVEEVLELGRRPEGVIYAVPGHPYVAEATAPEIARRARAEGLPLIIVEGLSFLEPTLAALGMDLLPQTTMVDALELAVAHHPSFPPDVPALIAQLHSQAAAAEVKLTLMALYPDDHPVQLVHAAGTLQQQVETLALHQIDRSKRIGLLSTLYLPPLEPNTSFEAFQELIAHLRAPEGCPWDREQTHQSLRPNLLEECYELLQAIDADDPQAMREELGDLLLQILLHAQIAAEYGEFTMSDSIHDIHSKLVRRHPHVFGGGQADSAAAAIHNWERLKAEERHANDRGEEGVLDGVPVDLPALTQALTYQRRAARVGFDWPEVSGVLDKIVEEIDELRAAADPTSQAGELGDLLFALVNLARWLQVDSESALRETNAKFRRRFASIEAAARKQGKGLSDMSLDEMDGLWEDAKRG